jgi:hypothetical protein
VFWLRDARGEAAVGIFPRSRLGTLLVLPLALRHHGGHAPAFLCWLLLCTNAFAQNWKQVHKKDEEKWAKATGLDPNTIHKLWRAASREPDEKQDDSRIGTLDLEGLAERHDVLLVTYAGEKNCLTLTVFRQLSETQFSKQWSVEKPPDGTGFCDTNFGNARAEAADGAVTVRVPRSISDGRVDYVVYTYEWNGITYHFTGQKVIRGK